MGRLWGTRPDPTARIARAVRRLLEADEPVLAGIDVQSPGAGTAGLAGQSAAIGPAIGAPTTVEFSGGEEEHAEWLREAGAMGIDPVTAGRSVWMHLVLTESRLVLVRRSRLTRRPVDVVGAWPVADVSRVEVPRNGSTVTVHRGEDRLRLELALAHKFLPDVYRDLPARLAGVQERARRR